MTIGDVLAALAVLMAVGFGWGATLLTAALAFPVRAQQASEALAASPGWCLARGLGVFFGVGLIALTLTHHPAGPVRLIGYVVWAALALTAAVGVAGLTRLMSERIQANGTAMNPFASLTRATVLLVLAGFVPLVGWFLVTPLVAFIALGSVVRRTPTVSVQDTAPLPNAAPLSGAAS